MSRPRYETAADLSREEAVAQRLADRRGMAVAKLTDGNYHYSGLDRVVYDPLSGELKAWVEIKCRKCCSTHYPTLMLSAGKWREGTSAADSTGVPFCVVVAYEDGDFVYRYDPGHIAVGLVTCHWGGRTTGTRDKGDIEPVMHIPVKLFRRL